MRRLNLDGVGGSDLVNRVKRFVYNNQYSLPVSISGGNQKLVIGVLEEGDFRFRIDGDLIIVIG